MKGFIQTILLFIILFLQVLFSGMVFLNNENINISTSLAFLNVIILLLVIFFGFHKLKKEIIFKKRIDIYEKITDSALKKVVNSFLDLTPFINNSYAIGKFNLFEKNDYFTELLRKNQKELAKNTFIFYAEVGKFFNFFKFWKAFFSEKIDNESKFLYDLVSVFYKDLLKYNDVLRDCLFDMEKFDEKKRSNLLEIDNKVFKNSSITCNALDKFVLDMSREVFDELYNKKESTRLFSLEIENLDNDDSLPLLTMNGIKKEKYKKTEFQIKFGGFKKRENDLCEFLKNN